MLIARGEDPEDFSDLDAARAIAEALAGCGLEAEVLGVLTGRGGRRPDPASWLARRGAEAVPDPCRSAPSVRVKLRGISLTISTASEGSAPGHPEEARRGGLLRLYGELVDRRRPDVVIGCGVDDHVAAVLARARARGLITALSLAGVPARDPLAPDVADAILVPSGYVGEFLRGAYAAGCRVLPRPIDAARLLAPGEGEGRGYAVFFDPTLESGVFAFARIADELGRRRPEIPLSWSRGVARRPTWPRAASISDRAATSSSCPSRTTRARSGRCRGSCWHPRCDGRGRPRRSRVPSPTASRSSRRIAAGRPNGSAGPARRSPCPIG